MNLPNKLSLLRVALIPVCVALLLAGTGLCRALSVAVFCLAAFTDFLDGYIARKNGIVTNFGKFIDPVADKLLVLCTVASLVSLGQCPAWICVVLLFRELAVDGLRMVAVEQGSVIAAGKLGKVKTVLQMLALIALLIWPDGWTGVTLGNTLMVLAVIMAAVSGAEYFIRNRHVLAGTR